MSKKKSSSNYGKTRRVAMRYCRGEYGKLDVSQVASRARVQEPSLRVAIRLWLYEQLLTAARLHAVRDPALGKIVATLDSVKRP